MSSPLADDLFRDQVMRARQSSRWDLFLDGWRLFAESSAWMIAGIRSQNPQFDDRQVNAELARRMKIQEMLEAPRGN